MNRPYTFEYQVLIIGGRGNEIAHGEKEVEATTILNARKEFEKWFLQAYPSWKKCFRLNRINGKDVQEGKWNYRI